MSNSYNLRLTSILDPRVRAGQPAEETREQTRGENSLFICKLRSVEVEVFVSQKIYEQSIPIGSNVWYIFIYLHVP